VNRHRKGLNWFGYAILGVSLVIAVVVRLRFLDMPLERDEGEYAYIAQLLLRGIPPYAEAYTMKFPGTPLAYALAFFVAGPSLGAIRGALLVANLAAAGFLLAIVSRQNGRATAALATGLFLLWSLMPELCGLWSHATSMGLPFALAGWYLVARAIEGRRTLLQLFAAGLLFGCAILMKQQAAIFIAPSIAYYWSARRLPISAVRGVAAMGVGVLVPLLAMFATAWSLGAMADFWYWTVTYARSYSLGTRGSRSLLSHLTIAATNFGSASYLLDGLFLLGLASLAWDPNSRRGGALWGCLGIGGLLAVIPSFWFFPHHFAFFLPTAAFYAAIGLEALSRLARRFSPSMPRQAWRATIVTAALACIVIGHAAAWFTWSDREMTWRAYPSGGFAAVRVVGEHLRDIAGSGDTLAVIGSEPELYFYSQLPGATRFLYTYPFIEEHEDADKMHDQMIREITESAPTYCVMVNNTSSWGAYDMSCFYQEGRILDWWSRYAAEHYDRVGLVSALGEGESVAAWGGKAATARPHSTISLEVWRRQTD